MPNGGQELSFEGIAVNDEVLGTGEAFELDGDLTPEELAEALGVPVDTIEIIDANGGQELKFEGIAVNDEVLGTGEAFELDGDLTPEELAEALGVPVDTIEIIDVNGGQELSFEDIALNDEVLGTGEAFELDGELTPEELAEALGVPVDTIEIIDVNGGQELSFEGIAVTDEVLGTGEAFELDGELTPEELAEALGVPVDTIEIIDVNGGQELSFEGIAVTDEVLEIGEAFELDGELTPEELAEALGVPVDTIEIIDVYPGQELSFEDIAVNDEVLRIAEAFELDVDLTPEELAEALGVPFDTIEFIDVMGESSELELATILETEMRKITNDFRSAERWSAAPARSSRPTDEFFASLSEADDDEVEESAWLFEEAWLGSPFRMFS